MKRAYLALLVALAVLAGFCGCGKRLHPVGGTLVWENGQPAKELAGAMIYFESTEHRSVSRSVVQADGHFELTTERPESRSRPSARPAPRVCGRRAAIVGGSPLPQPRDLGPAGRDVYHCDLYRLRDPEELEDLGLRELLAGPSLLLVEWPERAGDRLRDPDLRLHLEYADEGRHLVITPATEAGRRVVARLRLDPA